MLSARSPTGSSWQRAAGGALDRVAIYNVNVAVTRQAEEELRARARRGRHAGRRSTAACSSTTSRARRGSSPICRCSRPRSTPTTRRPCSPMAARLSRAVAAPTCCSSPTGNGQVLASASAEHRPDRSYASPPRRQSAALAARVAAASGRSRRHPADRHVPIWIDPRQPEMLGTLSVGVSLDSARRTVQAVDQQRNRVRR